MCGESAYLCLVGGIRRAAHGGHADCMRKGAGGNAGVDGNAETDTGVDGNAKTDTGADGNAETDTGADGNAAADHEGSSRAL